MVKDGNVLFSARQWFAIKADCDMVPYIRIMKQPGSLLPMCAPYFGAGAVPSLERPYMSHRACGKVELTVFTWVFPSEL